MRAINFKNNRLSYIDQTQLPLKEVWKECKNEAQGYKAIKELQVRGAPLIGVFAAYCVWLGIKHSKKNKQQFYKETLSVIDYLQSCRPTAVNLAWALGRIKSVLKSNKRCDTINVKKLILKEARQIHKQDIELCQKMAKVGVKLVKNNDTLLTHCNAGCLATSGDGTAVAVIYEAAKRYRNIKVFADETRPLLQGSRLTVWELMKRHVDVTVICDNMAAYLMQQGKIDKIFVGADRVCSNGDAANKIGTYGLAVAARYHKIPFYIVAPSSTFDLSLKTGKQIPIEQRNPEEVRKVAGKVYTTPKNAKVYNPAFDVTPNELITAIVTDVGILRPPYHVSIKRKITK